jgi:UBA/TS-N domain
MSESASSESIHAVFSAALSRLNRTDKLEEYLAYIRSEWYFTVPDLLMAIDDEKAWSDLKLPGRLKLEVKSELLGSRSKMRDPVASIDSSSEHDTFFYYCLATDTTQWEIPEGNVEISDDVTALGITDGGEHLDGGCAEEDTLLDTITNGITSDPSDESGGGYTDENLDILVAVNSKKKTPFLVTDAFAVNGIIPIGIAVGSGLESHGSFTSEVTCDSPSEADTADDAPQRSSPDPVMLFQLIDMGFSRDAATSALRRSNNDLPAATSILLRMPPTYEDSCTNATEESSAGSSSKILYRPRARKPLPLTPSMRPAAPTAPPAMLMRSQSSSL